MSDFLMNLARRAVGEEAPGAEIAPSPNVALAERMALPVIAAPEPAPPAITAIPPAPAPVMRQVVSPPPAAPPPPAAVSSPVVLASTQPESHGASMPASARPMTPASVEEGTAAAVPVSAVPQAPDRLMDLWSDDAPRSEPRRVEVPEPAAPAVTPFAEAPADVIARIAPPVPRAEASHVAPVLQARSPTSPPLPATSEASPSLVRPPAAPAVEAPRVEREPIERAPAVPRPERPPTVPTVFARRDPNVSPASSDATEMLRQRGVAAVRRTVDVRIGSIDVHLTPPTPQAPSERPALAGFEEYAALRNPVRFDGE